MVGVWDDATSTTPVVLYKHYAAWTAEDAGRIIAHVEAQTAEQQAEVRALRGSLANHWQRATGDGPSCEPPPGLVRES